MSRGVAMAAQSDPVTSCAKCPSWTGKQCGHKVLYGPDACWRRDGMPERKCGEQDMKSPFAGEGGGE